MINAFFASIGENLSRNPAIATERDNRDATTIQTVSNIQISEKLISSKIKAVKTNKATGPDQITPKLLRIAEPEVVPPLTKLYSLSVEKGKVFDQWKTAHLCPVFKKDDPTDTSNYRPISLLSVPSKILESCVADTLVEHVMDNGLLTDKQWAYRKNHSTQLLLVHLTECWRQALDRNLVVATAFVDFRKAFDCVSHKILLSKLKHRFGIEGHLLSWLTDYLNQRSQITVVNSAQSKKLKVTCGIPQGSVLGPCLFSLYTNDMPDAVSSGTLFLYADDTTVYCTGSTVDEACSLLNKALNELNEWCVTNSLTPHSTKCEAMLLHRGSFIGPHPLITIGSTTISWVHHTRLLGVIIDHKLTWSKHLSDLKRNFSKKLNLLKKCSFLKRRALLDLYFKVILPSVTYGIIVWGGCNNSDHIQALETLHRRAARIIFNLSWDTPSDTVMEITKWDSILDLYKLSLIKLFYNIVIEKIPKTISDLVTWRHGPYNLRGHLKAVVPRFSTSFLKNSIRYRGAVLWNFVSSYFNNATNHKQFCKKARMDPIFKKLNFGSLSIQTTPKHMCDFQF